MSKHTSKKGKGKFSKTLSVFATVLAFAAGFALILYPTVANRVNEKQNHADISAYRSQVGRLNDSQYNYMLKSAVIYNEDLFENTPYIGELTAEKKKVYDSLLDVGGNGIIGYIEIEKIGVNLAIYHGTEDNVLQAGVGHIESSSLPVPGKSVHTVLSAHSGLPSARLFTDLDRLEIGDTFKLHVLNETLTYEVEEIKRVLPEELKSMRIERGRELCTLLTCTPYGVNTHRLVVTGHRIETVPETPGQTEQAAGTFLASSWYRIYLLLPVLVFTALAAIVAAIRKAVRKRKQKKINSKKTN